MRLLEALNWLRTRSRAWLVAAIGVYFLTIVVSVLLFGYNPLELGSLFIATGVFIAIIYIVAWIAVFIAWFIAGRPNTWFFLILLIIIVAALCFLAMFIPQPILADLGEMLEPVFSSLKK